MESRTNVLINAGRSGNDGPSNTSDPTAIGNGGSCAIEFIEDLPGGQLGNADVDFVQGSAGDGGFAGPRWNFWSRPVVEEDCPLSN